jgi:hypothetical protein
MTPQPVASAPAPISLPILNPDETKDPFIHYPDASFPQPSSRQPDADSDRERGLDALRALLGGGRPGFNMGGANAGMLGQMPLAGATGYTPPGQGVTGMDSQGSPMGSGSAKAAGFDGLFGSGFQRGGRIGFAEGGLAGLGMDPSQSTDLSALLAAIGQPLPMGPGVHIPRPPEQKDQKQSGSGFGGLGDALSKLGKNAQSSQGSGLDSLGSADFADISAAGPDMSGLSDADFANFGLGGIVRPRFQDGGVGDGTNGTTAAVGDPGVGTPGPGNPGGLGFGISGATSGSGSANAGNAVGGHGGGAAASGSDGFGAGGNPGNQGNVSPAQVALDQQSLAHAAAVHAAQNQGIQGLNPAVQNPLTVAAQQPI